MNTHTIYVRHMQCIMEHTFSAESMVRGHHKYQDAWDAPVYEVLVAKERWVMFTTPLQLPSRRTVKLLAITQEKFNFYKAWWKITCQVTGRRQHSSDSPQGGLEIPYKLTFHTNKKRSR